MFNTKKSALITALLLSFSAVSYANSVLMQQAYDLVVSGNIGAGNKLYQQLLNDHSIAKHEVYFSRAIADINRLDVIGSDKYYALAVQALADNPAKANILMDFDYKRAALLINKGEYASAIIVLKPYVFQNNGNVRMQADYLDANFRAGNYAQVVADAKTFWQDDYTDKPIYGMGFVADSLFKLKKYAEAEVMYRKLLNITPDNFFAQLSWAYCLVMTGQDELAMTAYQSCFRLRPNADELVLSDANTLFATGKKVFAKKLYKLLEERGALKDKLTFSKAQTLGANNYPLASNQLLSSLATQNTESLVQRFNNYMGDELYYDASQTLKKLHGTAAYYSPALVYKEARKAGMGASFVTTSNYKGNSTQSYRLDGDAYIDHNTTLLGIIDNTRLADGENTATVNTATVGLVHRFERGRVFASVSNAVAGTAHTLYDAGVSYKLDDMTAVDFLIGKRYIGYTNAVLNDFITEKYYTVALARKINARNSFAVDYTTSSVSDSNHFYGYGLNYSYFPVQEAKKTHEFFGYYMRSGFNKLSDYYETPDKRIAYGLGWQGRWELKNNSAYWLVRLNLEFGYDNLEPTDFSPSMRVEYGHPLSTNQDFIVAVEYGVRTNRLNNIRNFVHGYKQLELRYNLNF